MSALQKILIVDDGSRRVGRSLSAELAELGYASVTASVEAIEDVLEVLGEPSAIVIDMATADRARRSEFVALAERLRQGPRGAATPILELDGSRSGAPVDIGGWMRTRTLNAPDR